MGAGSGGRRLRRRGRAGGRATGHSLLTGYEYFFCCVVSPRLPVQGGAGGRRARGHLGGKGRLPHTVRVATDTPPRTRGARPRPAAAAPRPPTRPVRRTHAASSQWRESPEERAARGFTPSTPEQAIPGAGAKKRLDTQEGASGAARTRAASKGGEESPSAVSCDVYAPGLQAARACPVLTASCPYPYRPGGRPNAKQPAGAP